MLGLRKKGILSLPGYHANSLFFQLITPASCKCLPSHNRLIPLAPIQHYFGWRVLIDDLWLGGCYLVIADSDAALSAETLRPKALDRRCSACHAVEGEEEPEAKDGLS